MKQKTMYKADISRNINSVIKVGQDDTDAIAQELREYVVTAELRRHFRAFLEHYAQSLTQPTDQIGVWISGFFGSGKSHFLKMLSYLLADSSADGVCAADEFAEKLDDPELFAALQRCAGVPTETILFNIDAKSPLNKDKTAILRIFAKVFYEHLGFCGDDLHTAQLEQFLAESGKFDDFQEVFARIRGTAWTSARGTLALIGEDVVKALTQTLGISPNDARRWLHSDAESSFSIEQLVTAICTYLDSRGGDFRLLFLIDEVGQYIGTDTDLLLNLQTITEEIGTRCGGRVWVIVTSQEEIGSLAGKRDFSKIQGRFHTRLHLSSSSVEEVIRKRLLAKNPQAQETLLTLYEHEQTVLRNLFSCPELGGYADAAEFAAVFPFVPYQSRLMQEVLAQIRRNGSTSRHLSGGERSMLSCFQEAAQAVREQDEAAIVPFWRFYDSLQTFLDGSVRGVVDRCQKAADTRDGIMPEDVPVLKLLSLVRGTECFRTDLDTLTVLMLDDIRADKSALRRSLRCSLERLAAQDFVSRTGDVYAFLTEEEQTIARAIRSVPVSGEEVRDAVGEVLFGTLFPSRKCRCGGTDFAFSRMIDGQLTGRRSGELLLHIVTPASELYAPEDAGFLMRSAEERAVIAVLPDTLPFFEELELALKIRAYSKSRNLSQLPESSRDILRARIEEAAVHEQTAEQLLAQAITESRIFAAGTRLDLKTSSVKERLGQALSELAECVYSKLHLLTQHCGNADECAAVFRQETDFIGANAEAAREVLQYLEMQQFRQSAVSVGDLMRRFSAIPYGWQRADILALTAGLIADGKLAAQTTPEQLTAILKSPAEADALTVSLRNALSPAVLKSVRGFLSEYCCCGLGEIPDAEDALREFAVRVISGQREKLHALLSEQYAQGRYPGKAVTEEGITLCDALLAKQNDGCSLLESLLEMQDDLLDHADEMADVLTFFRVQKPIFDKALALLDGMTAERLYFAQDRDVREIMDRMREILTADKPYRRISALPELMQMLTDAYGRRLAEKRGILNAELQAAGADFPEIREAAEAAGHLTELDALRMQLLDAQTAHLRGMFPPVALKSEADIDNYLAGIRRELTDRLDADGVLHIF